MFPQLAPMPLLPLQLVPLLLLLLPPQLLLLLLLL